MEPGDVAEQFTIFGIRRYLLTGAKKLESEVLSTIKFTPEHVSGDLDKLLRDAYAIRCPKPINYFNKKDLIRIVNIISKEVYGNSSTAPVVEVYGSFDMDMFCDGSDLDLSINFVNNSNEVPRQKKIETLRKFAKKFHKFQRKGIVRGVRTILTARVPIVKVIDCGTGIECDLSVDNIDGIEKSHIIHAISLMDERFQKLSFLTRNPPILSPFSALLKDGSDLAAVKKVVDNYISFGEKNVESLAELFITLFVKLEDFTDQSQNVARAVGTDEVKTIYRCIRESLGYFSDYLNGKMLGTKLIDLLFGGDTPSTTSLVGAGDIIDKNMKNPPISENQPPPKRQRLVEDSEIKQIEKPSEGNYPVQGNQRAEPWKGSVPARQGGTTFQPPAICSSYDKLPLGYRPGTAPSVSAQNQLGFGGSFNSHQLSNLVPVPNSIGYLGAFHQQAVHPNPSLGPIHSLRPLDSSNLYQGGPSSSPAQK